MYKCSNNLVSDYISDIIPPRVAEVSNYPLRNRDNISNIYNRTETARRFCIPSFVTHWNSLRTNVIEADTYLSFRGILKDEVLCNANFPSYFLKGQRKLSVLHARIRNSYSDLKCDSFQNHLTDDKMYNCGHDNENALHYFFECNNYTHQRIIMLHQTRNFHPLSLNAVLFGKLLSLTRITLFLRFQAFQITPQKMVIPSSYTVQILEDG